jgi:hypothetical protein
MIATNKEAAEWENPARLFERSSYTLPKTTSTV